MRNIAKDRKDEAHFSLALKTNPQRRISSNDESPLLVSALDETYSPIDQLPELARLAWGTSEKGLNFFVQKDLLISETSTAAFPRPSIWFFKGSSL